MQRTLKRAFAGLAENSAKFKSRQASFPSVRYATVLLLSLFLVAGVFSQQAPKSEKPVNVTVNVPKQEPPVVNVPKSEPKVIVEGDPAWVQWAQGLGAIIAALGTVVAVIVAARALGHSSKSAEASRQSAQAAADSLKHTEASARAAQDSVQEMRRQAAAAKQPEVLAYLAFHEESGQLQVVIENFGGGPAKDVFTTPPAGLDENVDEEYYVVAAFSKRYTVMPPGYRVATPVGPASAFRGNAKLCQPFTVKVQWRDLSDKPDERELTLDVTAFVDAWSPRSSEAALADSVGKLAKEFSWFNKVHDAKSRGITMTRGLGGILKPGLVAEKLTISEEDVDPGSQNDDTEAKDG